MSANGQPRREVPLPEGTLSVEVIHDGASVIVLGTFGGKRWKFNLSREQLKGIGLFLVERAEAHY